MYYNANTSMFHLIAQLVKLLRYKEHIIEKKFDWKIISYIHLVEIAHSQMINSVLSKSLNI